MTPRRPTGPTPRDLEAHAEWVRGLASALARDPHAADDLVQDTWAAALSRPPRASTPLRPWLAQVVRNAFLQRVRGERHRREREAAAAARESTPSGDDTAVRLERERRLVDALTALEEPLRATVVARYLGGESSADIARRTGVPAATVRWRLQQGLARLREALRERSDSRPLAAFLAPLLERGAPSGPALPLVPHGAGAFAGLSSLFVMHATAKLALVVAACAAGLGLYLHERPIDRSASVAPGLEGATSPASTGASLDAPLPQADGARSAAVGTAAPDVAASAPSSASESAEASTSSAVEARLVDARGAALNGALVARVDGADIVAPTDATGRCRLVLTLPEAAGRGPESGVAPPLPRTVLARAPGYATRFEPVALEAGRTVALGDLVLERGAVVRGVVLLPDGAPAAGAHVVAAPHSPRSLEALERCGPDERVNAPQARAAADGRFELADVAPGQAYVWAGAPEHRWAHSSLLELAADEVHEQLVLQLVALAREDHIAGIVVDPRGAPVPFAHVRYRATSGRSSHMGNVDVDGAGRFDHRLTLLAPHTLTASDPRGVWASLTLGAVAPGSLELVLRLPEKRELVVEAVDLAGAPVPDYAVEFLDASGAEVIQALPEAPRAGGRARVALPASHARLRVVARGFDLAETAPIDAETAPAVVRVALTPLPGLRGRVTSGEAPVAGATVVVHQHLWPRMTVDHGGFASRLDPAVLDRTVTDRDGRFTLTPRTDGDLAVLVERDGDALAEAFVRSYSRLRGAPDIALVLTRGGALEGHVLSPAGRTPEGTIVAVNRGDLRPRTARVGADGFFRFEGLTPGAWDVRRSEHEALPAGGTGISQREGPGEFPANAEVRAGETTVFDLDLRDARACVVRGRLVLGGEPARGHRVALWPDADATNSPLPSAELDAEGRFTLEVESPETRRLRFEPPLTAPEGPRVTARVTLQRGDNVVDVALAVGRVAGRVPAGERSSHVTLVGRCDESVTFWAPVHQGAEGAFDVAGVPAGDVELVARPRQGGETVVLRRFRLEPGATATLE